jgi:peptidoglycan/xylan/chitin deacetylase (PgdA/CDA1 family)
VNEATDDWRRRDFQGYGPHPPRINWPHGERIAVSLVVNYEPGAEYSHSFGDEFDEAVAEFGVPINPTDPRQPNLCTQSVFEYEGRAGIWRIARILDEFAIKATFSVAAQAVSKNPAVGEYIRSAGHEPASHGLRWEELWRLSREEEAAHLHEAVSSIATTCGSRPVGWHSRCTPSVNTRGLLVEEGGFIYDSDSYADDLPYFVQVGTRSHLVIPYSFVYNDMRFAIPGYSDPDSFFTYLRRGFDVYWEEGATVPKLMTIGVHPRYVGHAARSYALRAFISYSLERGEVWFARRADIATWWLDHHSEWTGV